MYTKGPWEVKSATFTEKGVAFEVIMSEQVICAGDAKLIEAAPAMYEALRAMYGNWIVRPDDEINALIYKMAGQAIAEVEKC